ncbi:hypothetical protein [uncultured Alteromonas sp.]|uniref:Ig-like domain-containing protein n=1 Tax=uncultured Alteromonas sp. TaxID=179113 RepID=UPI0030D157FE|tara:strand:- start:5384 stop:6937 length:1554 start_codon:yes stop_codon:yes gene_type:complete
MKFMHFLFLLFCLVLVGCGGGGSDSSPPSIPPTNPPSPTNQAPVLQLGQSSITLVEGQTGSVTVNVSDSDSDSYSIAIDTALEGVTYDEAQGTLSIEAQSVSDDISDSITVTATDVEGASSEERLTVNITDKPNASPVLTWVGSDSEPDFIVRERTELRLPFSVVDADNDTFTYDVSFSLVQGQGSSDIDIQVSVDEETNELVVNPQSLPSAFALSFRGTFTVSDENTSDSETFLIEIKPNSVALNISLRSVLIVEGDSQQIPFTITANDIDLFEFTAVEYVNEEDAAEDPLDFSIDKDSRLFNISAKAGFAGRTVRLRISFDENGSNSFTRVLPVVIRGEITANETTLMAKLENYLTLVNQTNDYEYVTRYALDILFARDELTKSEYLDLVDQNNNIRAVNVAFAKLVHSNTFENLTTSTLYTDPVQYQQAMEQLDSWLNNVRIFRDENVPFTTQILDRLGWAALGSEESVDIGDGTLSRFVGNTSYGSYVNNEWFFDEQYQYLEAPIELLINDEI